MLHLQASLRSQSKENLQRLVCSWFLLRRHCNTSVNAVNHVSVPLTSAQSHMNRFTRQGQGQGLHAWFGLNGAAAMNEFHVIQIKLHVMRGIKLRSFLLLLTTGLEHFKVETR